MIQPNNYQATANLSPCVPPRCSASGHHPDIFTDIYRDDTYLAIWQRSLSDELKGAVTDFMDINKARQGILAVTPHNTIETLCNTFGPNDSVATLGKDIALLVDMFCCLFDLKRAGLRLTKLDMAMCPRFHVDRVPCRLVTTYQGVATEWLPHEVVDRSKLGAGHQGKPDEQSGLVNGTHHIQRLSLGDVALLKGENWYGNEGAGVVHRSPPVPTGEKRLLLTLDFIDD